MKLKEFNKSIILFYLAIITLLVSCGGDTDIFQEGDIGSGSSQSTTTLTEEEIKQIIDANIKVEAEYINKDFVYLLSCKLNTSIGNKLNNKTVTYGMEYGLMENNTFYVEFNNWTGNDSQLAVSIVVPESINESLANMAEEYLMYYSSYRKVTEKMKNGEKLMPEELSLYTKLKNLMTEIEIKAKRYFKARNYVSVNGTRYYFSSIQINGSKAEVTIESCHTDEERTVTNTCEWCDGDGRCHSSNCTNGLCDRCDGRGYTYRNGYKDPCAYCNHGKCPSCNGTTTCGRCHGKGSITKTEGGVATKEGQIESLEDSWTGGSNDQGTNDGENRTFTVNGVSFTMVAVKAGTFQMGSTSGEDNEKPVHSVTISKDYYIGETEVTQALWKAVTGQSPTNSEWCWISNYGLGDNYPAYYINYEDAQNFIIKLNQMTGLQFRMPTEAEWEFAAKGGNKSKGYTYCGSNSIDDVAWYEVNSDFYDSYSPNHGTHAVKTKAPNELGIYDMSGNVEEWCSDWYGLYSSSAITDPEGPASGSSRVLRGGAWIYDAEYCRTNSRNRYHPLGVVGSFGLRLAL